MTQQVLIGYDIACPKRLAKIHRRLKSYGIAIQYSLFLCRLTEARLDKCIKMLKTTMNPKADDIRLYVLPRNPQSFHLGRAVFPEGISYTGLPSTFQTPAFSEEELAMVEKSEEEAGRSDPVYPDLKIQEKKVRIDKTSRRFIARCQTGQTKGILYIP